MTEILTKLMHRHVKKQAFVFSFFSPLSGSNLFNIGILLLFFTLEKAESVTTTPRLSFKPTFSTNGFFFKRWMTEIHFLSSVPRSGVMNNAALNIPNLTERCICRISSISTVFWKRGDIIRQSDCSPSLPPSLTYCLRNANQKDNWLPPTCSLTCISMGIFRQNQIPPNPRVGVIIKSLNVQGLSLLPPAHFIFTVRVIISIHITPMQRQFPF